jgi:hypothetical protein
MTTVRESSSKQQLAIAERALGSCVAYGGFGGKAEIVEDARLEDAPSASRSDNLIQLARQSAVRPHHSRNRGPRRSATDECVADFTRDALDRAIVDIGVAAVQIAQRLLNSARPGFKDKPTMLRWV